MEWLFDNLISDNLIVSFHQGMKNVSRKGIRMWNALSPSALWSSPVAKVLFFFFLISTLCDTSLEYRLQRYNYLGGKRGGGVEKGRIYCNGHEMADLKPRFLRDLRAQSHPWTYFRNHQLSKGRLLLIILNHCSVLWQAQQGRTGSSWWESV